MTPASRRILYICHNHLSSSAGGVEVYALELYHAMRARGVFEPLLLARSGEHQRQGFPAHAGTMLSAADGDQRQYLFFTDVRDYDALMITNYRKQHCVLHFRRFLETYRPELVHFHHTLLLGLEFITEVRQTLPRTPIVYTLHEYVPICHNHGQMVRTGTGELCLEASPRRCHQCFPDVSAQSFFLRKRFVQAHFDHVDQFVAPSHFLLERFVDWGISRDKIAFEEYGRDVQTVPADPPDPDRKVTGRFGFFGRLTPFKGVDVLLTAVQILMRDRTFQNQLEIKGGTHPFHVYIHGLDLQLTAPEYQARIRTLLDETRPFVTLMGPYGRSDLAEHMACVDWTIVPSLWWENSPLVIQESFAHRRPVICSGIGGMAEKVRDGVDGLHFKVNDPISLAETMKRAMTTPELHARLCQGIQPVHDMATHVERLTAIYERLLAGAEAP